MVQMPVLTASGFEGRRFIIDDYFVAGEDLNAGDAVGVKEDPADGQPKLYKVVFDVEAQQFIGFVHTPADKEVGDRIATAGSDARVPVVTKGIARSYSAGDVGVGDPMTPAGSLITPPQKLPVTRLRVAREGDTIVGRCLSWTSETNKEIDVSVDLAGLASGGMDDASVPVVERFSASLAPDCWYGLCEKWEARITSANLPGNPARFYSFDLEQPAEVRVYLESNPDAHLYLLDGEGTGGVQLASNDNVGPGTRHAEIVHTLQPGAYTIEATSSEGDAAMDEHFSLAVTQTVTLANLAVAPGRESAEISWDEPAALPPNCGYRVQVSGAGPVVHTVHADSSPVTVDGLEPGASYTASVSVRFDCPGLEERAFSNVLSAAFSTEPEAVPVPVNLTLRLLSSDRVYWSFNVPEHAPQSAVYLYEAWLGNRRTYSTTFTKRYIVAGEISGSNRVFASGIFTVKVATRVTDSSGNDHVSGYVSESIEVSV